MSPSSLFKQGALVELVNETGGLANQIMMRDLVYALYFEEIIKDGCSDYFESGKACAKLFIEENYETIRQNQKNI